MRSIAFGCESGHKRKAELDRVSFFDFQYLAGTVREDPREAADEEKLTRF